MMGDRSPDILREEIRASDRGDFQRGGGAMETNDLTQTDNPPCEILAGAKQVG